AVHDPRLEQELPQEARRVVTAQGLAHLSPSVIGSLIARLPSAARYRSPSRSTQVWRPRDLRMRSAMASAGPRSFQRPTRTFHLPPSSWIAAAGKPCDARRSRTCLALVSSALPSTWTTKIPEAGTRSPGAGRRAFSGAGPFAGGASPSLL